MKIHLIRTLLGLALTTLWANSSLAQFTLNNAIFKVAYEVDGTQIHASTSTVIEGPTDTINPFHPWDYEPGIRINPEPLKIVGYLDSGYADGWWIVSFSGYNAKFEGLAFYGLPAEPTDVTLTTTIPGFTIDRLSWDANSMHLNLTGLEWTQGQTFEIVPTFGVVPEPPLSATVAGLMLIPLAAFRRYRNRSKNEHYSKSG